MPKLFVNAQQTLTFPQNSLQRPNESLDGYWLEHREDAFVLHPRRPDVRKLYIEPTTGCNLNCRTCIRHTWEDPAAVMAMSTFARIVHGLDHLPNLNRVVFAGFGEPLSHPHILDMIAAMRERNVPVTVSSNGIFLNPRMARELVRLGVDRLMISVDGGNPETYADIRGAMLSGILDNLRNLNEAKSEQHSLFPTLGIEFVAMKNNVAELPALSKLASRLGVTRILVSNVLAYSKDMRDQVLYGYGPRAPLTTGSWHVRAGAWVMWGTLDLPRMHWSAERRCRFVEDRSSVIGWDGGVAPCLALSHNYTYLAVDGKEKHVNRYILGNVNEQSLAETWMSEDYVRYRNEVRSYHFPSCPDCDLRETCDLRERNEGCWGWNPSCADCLWAQDIIRCP
ncbi:MAG: tungsten cofactor oxidoreductase radical SAM maturase [Chloroflexi bacterium]|nr:tungsten cofactor oxidoreductase radical SAM maturase [Chloroflexota bacterium]